MRCERCWREEGVEPLAVNTGDPVRLCPRCRREAPADAFLLRHLFLRFASRKELLRHYRTADDEEALRRWAEEAGLDAAEARRRVRREPVLAGLLRPARRARPPSRGPFGYRRQDGRLVPVPYEADVVRRVFRLYLRGHSLLAIADAVNGDRVPTRRGRRWHPSTLRFLLRNPLYAGYVRRAGHVREGGHEALVRLQDYREVQRRLSARCRRPSQKAERPASG